MSELDGEPITFACQTGGFESTSGDSLLGQFDGTDRRDVMLYAVRDSQEQLLVSLHELLHHELQWSTAWGLVAAMSGLLAQAGQNTARLAGVAVFANNACRDVHEIFATTVSSGVIGVNTSRTLLAGNDRYLGFLDRGLSLAGDGQPWPWQLRESAIQTTLRLMMQPASLFRVADLGFEHVRDRDLRLCGDGPDQCLHAVASSASRWWQQVFTELVSAWPDRGGDRGDEWSRQLPTEPSAMLVLKDWEEAVLIPRLQQVAQDRLNALGLAVLDQQGYLDVMTSLRESFVRLAPEDWQVEVFADGRGLGDQPLGAERESAVLHAAPAAVDLRLPAEFDRCIQEFQLAHRGLNYVVVLYMPLDTLHRQFTGVDDLPTGDAAVLALAGAASQADHQRRVPVALLQPGISAADLVNAFRSIRPIVLTSLRATRNPDHRAEVLDLPTAFILIDIPLRAQVDNWLNQGFTTRFRVLHLGKDAAANLVVFHLDELPMCWFLSYRSDAGFGELARLFDEHQTTLRGGLEVPTDIVADIGMITDWLFATWWRFEEAER